MCSILIARTEIARLVVDIPGVGPAACRFLFGMLTWFALTSTAFALAFTCCTVLLLFVATLRLNLSCFCLLWSSVFVSCEISYFYERVGYCVPQSFLF